MSWYSKIMSTNYFKQALNDLGGLEKKLLGPNYAYYNQIKNPAELGMSTKGDAISNNLAGLVAYTEVLVTGEGNASKPGGPLGDKFFLKTGAKCKDKETGEQVTRSLYFNNVPDGSIPFISQGLGTNFTTFRGLVPGTLSDMNQLNPLAIFSAFMQGTNPECMKITMPVRDVDNVSSTKTAYMTTSDIRNIPACWFSDGKNPLTKKTCSEGFNTLSTIEREDLSVMPDNPLECVYLSALGLLALYLMIKITVR